MKSILEYIEDRDSIGMNEASSWKELQKTFDRINDPNNTGPLCDASAAFKEALDPKKVGKVFETACRLSISSWRFEDNLKKYVKETGLSGQQVPYDTLSKAVQDCYVNAFLEEVQNALKKYRKEMMNDVKYACVQNLKCCKARSRL